MRIILYIMAVMLFFSSCKEHITKKPFWSNPIDTLKLPGHQLVFITDSSDWKAVLLTTIQPVNLLVKFKTNKLTVNLDAYGVTEGNAQICLSAGDRYFYYNVYLVNKKVPTVFNKEYRSPKTVNPDSSLLQQRVFHRIDVYRNLLPIKKHHYFGEDQITMTAKAGVYQINENTPLTSVYVQAGSTTTFIVAAKYDPKNGVYLIKAGPMRDKYNNTVADGTSVAFVYNSGLQTYRMESAALNGFSNVTIPDVKGIVYTVVAQVNNTYSKPVHLVQ